MDQPANPTPPDDAAARAPGAGRSGAGSPDPGWGYPHGYVPPAAPPPMPARPGAVTAAAVILIVLGLLVSLLGALAVLAGLVFPSVAESPDIRGQFGELSAALGGLILVVGAFILAYGLAELLTGIFLLAGRAWTRISGLVLAVLGILLSLVGVLPTEGGGAGTSLGFGIVLAAYAFVAWVLASQGSWFRR